MATTQPTIYGVYCDESRQDGSFDFRLVAGIWVPRNVAVQFVREYIDWCDNNLGIRPRHMKFSKVPNIGHKYFRFYVGIVDLFFDYMRSGLMSFRAVVVDRNYDFAHPLFNASDYDVGFYKLYYQLLVHWIVYGNSYHIRVAKRNVSNKNSSMTEKDRLDQLKRCLNKTVERNHGRPLDFCPPVKSVESRLARRSRLIQLADILMGAVGYHRNGEHLKKGAKLSKVALANYVAYKLGKKDLCFESPPWETGFNIFYHKP